MQHFILVNPMSGNKKGEKYAKSVQNLLKKFNIEANIIISTFSGSLISISRRLSKKEECRFYVLGGDGTLNEVVTGIMGTKSEIVIIPCGTGNDFIKSVSKYKSIRKIIYNSINTPSTPTDVIKLNNNKYCINILNMGFDAMVAKNVNIFRNFPFISGKSKYNLSIFYTLLQNRNFKFKIRTDNNIEKGRYTLIAISNGKFYGGGICPSDSANVHDGILDICKIASSRVREKIILLPKYQKGLHEKIDKINHERTKTISVVSTRKFPISIDGEIIYTNRIKASVIKDAVNIVHILDKT